MLRTTWRPIWACSRVKWEAKLHARVVIGPGNLERSLVISYKLHTTLVMQIAGDGSIQSAEVSARSQPYDVQPLTT